MDGGAATTPDGVIRALQGLLAAHPDARVAALEPDGRFCEVPDGGPFDRHRGLDGQAGIELVSSEYRAVVLDQFRQRHERGASIVDVLTADGQPARFAVFATADRYGVDVLVVIEGAGNAARDTAADLADLEPVVPRSGKIIRTETAELLDVDDATLTMLRYTREEFSAKSTSEMVHPDDYHGVIQQWLDLITAPPGTVRRSRVRYQRGDGTWLWVELTLNNHLDAPDQPMIRSEVADISEEMAALDEAWRRGELLRRLTEAMPIGMLEIDTERRVVYANDRLAEIVDTPPASTFDERLGTVLDEDRGPLRAAVDRVLDAGEDLDVEVRLRTEESSYALRYCQLAIRALRDPSEAITGAVVCVTDVTDNTRLRKELEVRAAFDALTQCYNRATVMNEIERAIHHQQLGTAVVFVDLDGFKPVNDRLGHSAGDEVLHAVADALRGAVRSHDVVGRLGGDEFVVLCPDVASRELAAEIGERVGGAACFDLDVQGESVPIRASVGVAWTTEPTTADSLVAAADAAMYASKRAGDHAAVMAPQLAC